MKKTKELQDKAKSTTTRVQSLQGQVDLVPEWAYAKDSQQLKDVNKQYEKFLDLKNAEPFYHELLGNSPKELMQKYRAMFGDMLQNKGKPLIAVVEGVSKACDMMQLMHNARLSVLHGAETAGEDKKGAKKRGKNNGGDAGDGGNGGDGSRKKAK